MRLKNGLPQILRIALILLIASAGCSRGSGGGSVTIDGELNAMYGYDRHEIFFAIFYPTRLGGEPGPSGTSAGSRVNSGYQQWKGGFTLEYSAPPGGSDITINKSAHSLSKGRIFLARMNEGKLAIEQLDVPLPAMKGNDPSETLKKFAREHPKLQEFAKRIRDAK